jgi:hypothetical protein
MQDYVITMTTERQLAVLRPSMLHDPTGLLLIALGIGMGAFFLLVPIRPQGIRLLFRFLGVCLPLAFLAFQSFSHEIRLDRTANTAAWVDRWLGIPYHTTSMPLTELRRVEIESSHSERRLAFLLTTGETVYPLGSSYNSQPNQYNVQDAVNAFLGVR